MPIDKSKTELHMLPRAASGLSLLSTGLQIVYPGGDPAFLALAGRVGRVVGDRWGVDPELVADTTAFPERSSPTPEALKKRPSILLGNLMNNRAVRTLYARYYCAADAAYPGGDGYDLRTMVNPYGTGSDVLLIGGSTTRGVERGVDRFVDLLPGLPAEGAPGLPFLLAVDLAPELARRLAAWPGTALDAPIPGASSGHTKALGATEGLLRAVGAYGGMYAWTGDHRYGEYAARCLKALNQASSDTYGDWHYLSERFLRALPWLNASGLLEAGDILRTDRLILGTLLGTEAMWWRMRSGAPPLGHRHQGKGTYEFLLAARYLLEQGHPNAAALRRCQAWIAECQQFLDALARAEIDDQDDESTLNNLATLTWYAFGEERFDYFASGAARRVAERAIALHDPMGAGAGQGGYAEGQAGAGYYQQEATVTVAAAAFYYDDPHLRSMLDRMPNLRVPLRLGFLGFTPAFLHSFMTSAEAVGSAPEDAPEMRVLPVSEYAYALNANPPVHYEPAGHSVNARETWMLGEGIGRAVLSRERCFNKIVYRGGFAPEAAYLLLQGYQGGFRWQGHMQAANCIVRFSQAGHIFLAQNTGRHSLYDKNGVFVNDGSNRQPLPPFAEWLSAAGTPRVAASASRLATGSGAPWTRHIFWSKAGEGFFVVLDTVAIRTSGAYRITCTWRTPASARLEGRAWSAEQGDHRFRLVSASEGDASSAVEEEQGAFRPTVLRQVQQGTWPAGERRIFQNLFSVRSSADADVLDLVGLEDGQALVVVDGKPAAWCAAVDGQIASPALGIQADALAAWAAVDDLLLLQARRVTLPAAGLWIECSQPVGLHFDLAARRLALFPDGPDYQAVSVRLQVGEAADVRELLVEREMVIDLPGAFEDARALIAGGLRLLQAEAERQAGEGEAAAVDGETPPVLAEQGRFSDWKPVPEGIRAVTVQASPPPLDGFAAQLVDGVLPEMRETWQQWPDAESYEITLRFPEETPVSSLRIIGDSERDPTLHSYRPLPEGIQVTASSDHFAQDLRPCPVEAKPAPVTFRRYRDVWDRMQARTVQVGQSAREIRVHVPRPPGGESLVLHEIEVYGAATVLPGLSHLLAVDLDGDGRQEVLAVNQAGEMAALSASGALIWRVQLPGAPSHVSCHDLRGDGQVQICLGLPEGELRILNGDGSLYRSVDLPARFRALRDSAFGWLHTINSLAVWRRDGDGRAALAVGGYASVAFLDPDLNMLGHSWADGAWQTDILPVDAAGGAGSLWVRNGWNHGICVYEARDSFEPSGEHFDFGGIHQPMFRALRKVIPFVTGPSLAFAPLGAGRILAAAEIGLGVLSIEKRDWVWKHEGGARWVACAVLGENEVGQVEIVTASADGFLTSWDAGSGDPTRSVLAGVPLTGLAVLPGAGLLAAATRAGLRVYDRGWRVLCQTDDAVERVAALADGTLVAEAGGVLTFYVLKGWV